ncbi:J domain-containing protein [Spirosoma flavum]|uniref:J domain-containing protein n=2 Tax=Spirosoma flavum TaxID=2048557 RepID=A0ABW6AHK1_9BACT
MNVQPSQLTIHPAKATLLAHIRVLEPQIAQLEEEKAACQYQIDQYYRLFRLYLGDLLTQTIDLQMQLALNKAQKTGRRSDAEEAQNWRDHFEQTNQAVREAIAHQPTNLGETDEHELRRLYRQAVTVAHPDRHINDPDRTAQATAYMMRLNDAYKCRDLVAIRRLVQELDDGRLFAAQPETIYDLEELRQWHRRLTNRQTGLQTEIDQLKADDAYRLMTANTDLIAHFSTLRDSMLQQIDHLKHHLQSL